MSALPPGSYSGNVVLRCDTAGAIASVTRYRREACAGEWHEHENLHLCHVYAPSSGESRARRTLDVPVRLWFYRAGEQHRWQPQTAQAESINLELSPRFFTDYGIGEAQLEHAASHSMLLDFLLLRLHRELELEGSRADVDPVLGEVAAAAEGTRPDRAPAWSSRAREFLAEEWNERITLTELARQLELHPVTVSRSFRSAFGCGFADYRRRLKVRHAIAMMHRGNRTLTAIALACGFADQSHFTRVFRALLHCSPRDFLRRTRSSATR